MGGKQNATAICGGVLMRCRRRPPLPRSLERSTIGAVGLNDRVRNGNECGPYALVASESSKSQLSDSGRMVDRDLGIPYKDRVALLAVLLGMPIWKTNWE